MTQSNRLLSASLALAATALAACTAPEVIANKQGGAVRYIGGNEQAVVAAAEAHCTQASHKDAVPVAFSQVRGHSLMTFDCR